MRRLVRSWKDAWANDDKALFDFDSFFYLKQYIQQERQEHYACTRSRTGYTENGGCDIDFFYEERGPSELIYSSYDLLRETPIKLCSAPEYKEISLRKILCKMGAIPE